MATTVEPIDPAKKNSEILGQTSDEATVQMDMQNEKCFWNDAEYSQGDEISSDGKCYTCSFGRWLERED